jgi:hypothetical protein
VPLAAGWDTEPIGDATDEAAAREIAAPGQHRWNDWAPGAPRPAGSSTTGDGNGPETAPSMPELEVAATHEPAAAASEAADMPAVAMPAAGQAPEMAAAGQTPEPEPATPTAEPEPEPAPSNGPPHLMIRVTDRGMVEAEMAGEVEPVILEDLTAYAEALANVGGTAEIVLSGNGGMGKLIATRAQRIMAEAGIEATIPD